MKDKKVRSINFEIIVLDQLEKKAVERGMKVSEFVNFCMKNILVSDEKYCEYRAQQALVEFQKWQERVKCASEMREMLEIER